MMGREAGLPYEPFWTLGKVLSLLIVGFYASVAVWVGEPIDATVIFFACVSPICLIWFPEVFGDAVATNTIPGPRFTKPTPARLVWLGGWLLLLLPLIRAAILVYYLGTEGLAK